MTPTQLEDPTGPYIMDLEDAVLHVQPRGEPDAPPVLRTGLNLLRELVGASIEWGPAVALDTLPGNRLHPPGVATAHLTYPTVPPRRVRVQIEGDRDTLDLLDAARRALVRRYPLRRELIFAKDVHAAAALCADGGPDAEHAPVDIWRAESYRRGVAVAELAQQAIAGPANAHAHAVKALLYDAATEDLDVPRRLQLVAAAAQEYARTLADPQQHDAVDTWARRLDTAAIEWYQAQREIVRARRLPHRATLNTDLQLTGLELLARSSNELQLRDVVTTEEGACVTLTQRYECAGHPVLDSWHPYLADPLLAGGLPTTLAAWRERYGADFGVLAGALSQADCGALGAHLLYARDTYDVAPAEPDLGLDDGAPSLD